MDRIQQHLEKRLLVVEEGVHGVFLFLQRVENQEGQGEVVPDKTDYMEQDLEDLELKDKDMTEDAEIIMRIKIRQIVQVVVVVEQEDQVPMVGISLPVIIFSGMMGVMD
jgi:hypothetical protein